MTNAPKGILKAPRYSTRHDAIGGTSRADVGGSSSAGQKQNGLTDDGVLELPLPSPNTPSAITSHGNKIPVRSLADLVRCSKKLNEEVRGIVSDDDDAVHIQQQPKVMHGTEFSSLQISEKTSELTADNNVETPNERFDTTQQDDETDPDYVVAVGVVGEDGQHVRFCEYEDEEEESGDIDSPSTRNRLDQKISNSETYEGSGLDDDYECILNEEEKKSDASDDDSDEDEEILAELGLLELMNDELEDEMIDNEHSISNIGTRPDEPRSFLVLWEALTRWATPSTIDLIRQYNSDGKNDTESVASSSILSNEETIHEIDGRNSVDIGASRRAGIMSMLKMNTKRSLSELKRMHKEQSPQYQQYSQINDIVPVNATLSRARAPTKRVGISAPTKPAHQCIQMDQRTVEQHLADLVKTFDLSTQAANFNMKIWKGMTTILIVIVSPSISIATTGDAGTSLTTEQLPASIRTLGMTVDEFRYLTQSALLSLSSTE